MHAILKSLIAAAIFIVGLICLFRYMTDSNISQKEHIMQNNHSGKYVKRDEIELWTETFGNKTNSAILLISGAMASAHGWTDEFCDYLANQAYFVIRFDHRDAGLSSSIDYAKNPYTLDDMIKDLVAILNAYKLEKVHLVGHSVGGTLALLFAVKHPERCSSITIISGITFEAPQLSEQEQKILDKTWAILLENKPTLDFNESIDGFLKSYKYLNGTVPFDEEMAQAYVKDMYERSKHMYKTKIGQLKAFEVPHNHVQAQQEIDLTKKDLQNITIPTLIIHGQEDYLALPVHAKMTAQAIPNATLIMMPGMGHMFFNKELEQQIANLILNHIQLSTKKGN